MAGGIDEFNPKDYVSHEAAWLAFRRGWLADNPPLDNGYYLCGICGRWVLASEVSLDHINGRGEGLTFNMGNIQTSHGVCNYNKGSRKLQPKVDKEQHDFMRMLSDMQ